MGDIMFRAMKYLVVVICLALISVVAQAQTIDINTATATELETLKGIGPAKAKAIVEYRTEHGAFQSVDDLSKVKGIGPKILSGIKDKVSVGGVAGTGLPKAPVGTSPKPRTLPATPPAAKPAAPAMPGMPATKP
jgi:competence protein ComEA